MKIASHYAIDEDGQLFRGALFEIADGKLCCFNELGLPLPELAQMSFHSGIIVPKFPAIDTYWETLCILRNDTLAPHWLQLMPETLDSSFYLKWIDNLQAADELFSLNKAVKLFCSSLPSLLSIAPSRFQLHEKVQFEIFSNIDYSTFRIKNNSKLRKLL
ncbi:MAG: hypothetical protein ACK5IJ_05135 [Mangrovibacterium sp.]